MSMLAGTVTSPADYAAMLLDLCDDVLATTSGGQIARKGVVPWQPALDCEMLAVSFTTLGLGATAPGAPLLATARRHVYGALNLIGFVIHIARDCVPVAKGTRGGPPDMAENQVAAFEMSEDVWAIWNALPDAMEQGELFGGRCSELFMDNAAAIPASGQIAGYTISIRASIPGYTP
jgi:hypothetical protein